MSTIELETVVKGEKITLCVKDKGIGIPEDDKQNLFRRFFRSSNVTNIQGTGLGLHIVSKYTELMNGTINVESKEGEGTTFIITFNNKKNEDNLLLEFTLPLADTDKLDTITNAIESAYEFSNPISWAISIDHEYI